MTIQWAGPQGGGRKGGQGVQPRAQRIAFSDGRCRLAAYGADLAILAISPRSAAVTPGWIGSDRTVRAARTVAGSGRAGRREAVQ